MTSFVINDVRIFTGEEVLESGSVLVEDGIIRYVGRETPSVDLPIITASNSTLMPGLIDAHIHADKGQVLAIEQSLRFGVTTVLDMHNESWNVTKLKKIAAQRKDVADFKSACFGATVDQGWPEAIVKIHDHSEETSKEIDKWPKLKNPEDAEPFVLENIKNGCDFIKLMHESGSVMGQSFNLPSLSLQSAVVKAAHAHNLLAVAHSICLEDTLAILKAGVDGMMHTFADKPPTEELLEAYKKNGAFCVPTLGVLASATGEGKTIQQSFADDPRVADLIEETSRENLCRCMEFAAKTSKMENAYENVRQLRAAGIDILCGSDAASPAHGTAWGLSMHLELHYLVKHCDITPEEALRAATSINARRFRLEDRGVIAVGRKADLILIEGNPLEDIGNTLNLKGVWRDGHRL
ncbi:hypothetical protein JMJ35_010475 [Cladonia borealis]|uniref:Amidohydrolase-related domain-containing protein n=1 Tax=Cladonia borealis TaxID=184061 RepID=A0AA39QQ12_9LECA|nr:hypothetical protein JMJ35_010475 [Cladonia borealis]